MTKQALLFKLKERLIQAGTAQDLYFDNYLETQDKDDLAESRYWMGVEQQAFNDLVDLKTFFRNEEVD